MTQFKADVDILTRNDSGRRRADVPLLVVHYYGGSSGRQSVEDMAPWLLNPDSGASYTGIIDHTGKTARINDDDYIPWAAMPTGNRIGRHWSLGAAAMSRELWLKRRAQLTALAEVMAHDHLTYGTELRELTVGEVFRARNDFRVRGITTHAMISKAFHESNHDDPGAGFPMDVVLTMARDIVAGRTVSATPELKENDMSGTQLDRIEMKCDLILDQLAGPRDEAGNWSYDGWPQGGGRSLYDLTSAIAEIEGVSGTRDTRH